MDALDGKLSPESRFLRGMWEGKRPRHLVVAEIEEALRNPSNAGSYSSQLAIGRYFTHAREDFDEQKALKYLRAASMLDPAQFEPHLEMYRVATRRGHRIPDLRRQQAEVCLSMRPELPVTWVAVGLCIREYDLKDPERIPRSMKYFQKAIELDPTRDDAHLHMGLSYYDLKKLDLAEQSLDLADASPPAGPEIKGEILVTRALVRASLGKWMTAYEDYTLIKSEEFVLTIAPLRYNLACTASLICKSVSSELEMDRDARDKLVRELRSEALSHLRGAIRCGFNKAEDYKLMREDSDLDAIRAEPEFRKIVEGK
jgi:tetratricopeptide (TPR) repeat protein